MSSGFKVTLTCWIDSTDDVNELIAAKSAIAELQADAAQRGFTEIVLTNKFMAMGPRKAKPEPEAETEPKKQAAE